MNDLSGQDLDGGLGPYAAMPMGVVVEVDRISLPMREIAALCPGDVLRLGRQTGDSLTLLVGGVTVARAEQVAGGGRTRVRISSLATHPELPWP